MDARGQGVPRRRFLLLAAVTVLECSPNSCIWYSSALRLESSSDCAAAMGSRAAVLAERTRVCARRDACAATQWQSPRLEDE